MGPRIFLLSTMLITSASRGQLVDPGFEMGTAWSFTCANGGGSFSPDAPLYGGTTCLSLPMLSTTQPDCYHVDGIIPRAYQVLNGVQNGDQITVYALAKCVPDVPANEPYMNAEMAVGWLTFGGVLDYQLSGFTAANLQTTWTQIGNIITLSGMPADATPVLMLGGTTFNNANGTVFFDNVTVSVAGSGAKLSAKAWLDGCYLSGQNLMRDDLRVAGLVPTTSPYGGGQTISPSLLNTSGNNAIVDWVFLELRLGAATPSTFQRPALIQRDGDIVDLDGTSPVTFNVRAGNYFVVLHHRNHLGVEGALPVAINSSTTAPLDFRNASTACMVRPAPHADLPRKVVGSAYLLWAGELSGDHLVKYTGSGNDRDNILASVGGNVLTNTLAGYLPTDVNMDGIVMYTGSGNDRDIILTNIGGIVPTLVRIEQVP